MLFLQNKRKPAATRKLKHKNTQTTKQENQIINTQTKQSKLGKQTQPSCVNNGSMYNRVKGWNKDGYGRREYVQREMYNLKLKWAIGKIM